MTSTFVDIDPVFAGGDPVFARMDPVVACIDRALARKDPALAGMDPVAGAAFTVSGRVPSVAVSLSGQSRARPSGPARLIVERGARAVALCPAPVDASRLT